MSDPVHLDVEQPDDYHPWDDVPEDEKPVVKKKKPKIRVLPTPEKPLTDGEIRRGVSNRARSAANLKIEGYSYQEIADLLELRSAQEAKRLVESTLAAIHPTSDLETLRLVVSARAETLLRRSMAMASADFLVDMETQEKLPNYDKLRWHQQAATDLLNYATMTGAKAPTKVEITPGEADYDAIVERILARSGHEEIVEAEVLELEQIPDDDGDE